MKTVFILLVIQVFMSSAQRWYQYQNLYPSNGVKYWKYPSNSYAGGYNTYGGFGNGGIYKMPYYSSYINSVSQRPIVNNAGIPLNNYAKTYQNHSYAYNLAGSDAQKAGTQNIGVAVYDQSVNPFPKYSYPRNIYISGLNLDSKGSDIFIPSIDYIIKKMLLRLTNPRKKLIDIERTVNLQPRHEPYWDSLLDEFVEQYYKANPTLIVTFQSKNLLNIERHFVDVLASFTEFLKLRWGGRLLSSNEILRNLYINLANYKTTPDTIRFLYTTGTVQDHFNNQDHRSFFYGIDQGGTPLDYQPKIPYFQIPLLNQNPDYSVDMVMKNDKSPTIHGNVIVGTDYQHVPDQVYTKDDVVSTDLNQLTDNISDNENLQNNVMNTVVSHNYPPGLNDAMLETIPETIEQIPISDLNVNITGNKYDGNGQHNIENLNENPMETNYMNPLKNNCRILDPTLEDIGRILKNYNIDKELLSIKLLFEIVGQFIHIHKLDNVPFGNVVSEIEKILLDNNDNMRPEEAEKKIGLKILLNEIQNGELGKLFVDLDYDHGLDLKSALDKLGILLYKYKQTLIQEGISEMSIHLLLRIAVKKSEKMLSYYFAEECKRRTSDYIWKSLSSALNLNTIGLQI